MNIKKREVKSAEMQRELNFFLPVVVLENFQSLKKMKRLLSGGG